MIDADSIFIDGDTVLVVEDSNPWLRDLILNSPCDTCDGSGEHDPIPSMSQILGDEPFDVVTDCGDCDGTGRHTFTVRVNHGDGYMLTLRVHVIDVLRVYDPATGCPGPASPHICWSAIDRRVGSDTDGCWLRVTNTLHDASPSIALPSAAAPGMWLTTLAVHP